MAKFGEDLQFVMEEWRQQGNPSTDKPINLFIKKSAKLSVL